VSTGGTKSYDETIYDTMVARMTKYGDAAKYCLNELGNKGVAVKMMDCAEKLKQVSLDYKTTNKFTKADLVSDLKPDVLFGMT